MGPIETTFMNRWNAVRETENPVVAIVMVECFLQQAKSAYYACRSRGYNGEIFRKYGTYWETKLVELRRVVPNA